MLLNPTFWLGFMAATLTFSMTTHFAYRVGWAMGYDTAWKMADVYWRDGQTAGAR